MPTLTGMAAGVVLCTEYDHHLHTDDNVILIGTGNLMLPAQNKELCGG
jgi:hypothetical protein